MKKKHHHFTAQHEDRREQRAVEESRGLRYDPAYHRARKRREKGGGRGGAGDSARTLPMMMLETQDKGLNKSVRSYLGERVE